MRTFRKKHIGSYVLLIIICLIWVIPLVWVVSTSLKTELEAVSWPITWIPKTIMWQNFTMIFSDRQAPVTTWFFNSFINATLHTLFVLIIASMSAYAFARFKFFMRDTLFFMMLGTMMIPNILNLVPLYSIVHTFGWVDTRWALIIPGLANVFGIFLLRQFFLGIPKEMEEAAQVDGANHFTIFTKLMLPLVRPGLIVLGLFTFLGNWNDYMWPLTVINSNEQRTITIGLSIIKGTYNALYAKMMALTLLSIIPIILIFIVAQRYFMRGANMSSGIKG